MVTGYFYKHYKIFWLKNCLIDVKENESSEILGNCFTKILEFFCILFVEKKKWEYLLFFSKLCNFGFMLNFCVLGFVKILIILLNRLQQNLWKNQKFFIKHLWNVKKYFAYFSWIVCLLENLIPNTSEISLTSQFANYNIPSSLQKNLNKI